MTERIGNDVQSRLDGKGGNTPQRQAEQQDAGQHVHAWRLNAAGRFGCECGAFLAPQPPDAGQQVGETWRDWKRLLDAANETNRDLTRRLEICWRHRKDALHTYQRNQEQAFDALTDLTRRLAEAEEGASKSMAALAGEIADLRTAERTLRTRLAEQDVPPMMDWQKQWQDVNAALARERTARESAEALARDLYENGVAHFDDEMGGCTQGCSHRWSLEHRHRRGDKCRNIGTDIDSWHDADCALVEWHDRIDALTTPTSDLCGNGWNPNDCQRIGGCLCEIMSDPDWASKDTPTSTTWTCANCNYMNSGPICTKCRKVPTSTTEEAGTLAEPRWR